MRGTHSFLALTIAVLLLACAPLSPARAAANPLVMQTEDERLVQWDLSADTVTSLNDSEVLEARGNVYLRRGAEYLKADFARYYMSTNWVFLQGNVIVRMGKDEIKAEEAEFDLRSRVGWLRNGQIFMEGPHAYLAGQLINKHWGDVYTFKDAKVTTCDGDVPAWSITADEAVVEIDGYARLSRSAFQIRDTPVAFSPYFVFPTKTRRQTGLLKPDFGTTTTKGVFYNQPFFWAINDTSDLTVNEHVMEKRGFMHGLQYRTRPSVDTAGWLRVDWLRDSKTITDDSQGAFKGDGLVRKNTDRYWVRGMYDTVLPDPSWRFKADLDLVSDQDYLSEFKNGFGGFNRSREELFDVFRRDLQEKNRDRVSGFLLTRDWERATVALSAQYTQNPAYGHGNTPLSEDGTVQRLPQADAYLHKGRIFPEFPLEIEASGQAGYMYRREGTRGARYEIFPRLSLPLTSRYGSIIASAGVRETLYNTEYRGFSGAELARNEGDRERERKQHRTLPEYDVIASTEFARVYPLAEAPLPLSNSNVGKSQWTALRHSVQPRVGYVYRPRRDQNANPYYDDEDRLTARTELVYSLTNVLTRKRETVVLKKNEDGEMVPEHQYSYVDFLRFRVEQAYDHREAVRSDERSTYSRRPFGDILTELEANVIDNVSVYTRNYWSPYENEFTRHQSGVGYHFPSVGSIYVGYDLRNKVDEYTRRREEKLRYLTLTGNAHVWGPWNVSAAFRQDYVNTDNRETEINISYVAQCFQIVGHVSIEPQEESYGLSIVLTGLGD